MSPTATATAPSRRRGIPARRLFDAIAGPHGIDRYLEQISPTLVIGECRAEVVAATHGTEDSVTLSLRPNRVWEGLRAGQFVQVAVEIDGVRHTRCYSPASPEGAGRELEITVKRHPEGLVSNFLVDRARPGMVIGLSQADGDFHLPEARPDSILLIGAGSGITPLMAIARTLCAEGHAGQIALIQYAPAPDRTIYREELDRLAAENPNFKLSRSYTRAPGAGELDGHFSPTHLPQADPSFTAAETFACGPPSSSRRGARHLGQRPRAPAARRELCSPQPVPRRRARNGLDPLRRLGPRGEQQRRLDPRAGRAGRRPGAVGMPHGDLPHLHLPQAERHRQEPAYGRGLRRT